MKYKTMFMFISSNEYESKISNQLTTFSQSESFIPAQHCCATLKFVNDIVSRTVIWKVKNVVADVARAVLLILRDFAN